MASDKVEHSGNIDFLYTNFIEAGTSGERHPFVAAAQQMVENSDDAGATRIDFQIEPGQHFRCIDDGIGVLREKMAGLNRLGFRNKGFEEIGKNGTGRAFNMKVAGEARSRFTSADFPVVMLHKFTRDDVRTILSNPTQPLDNPVIEDSNIPIWCSHLSGSKTGMAVELTDIDWELFTNLAKFRARLSDVLSVWMARKVFVNNERIKQREMDGVEEGSIQLSADFSMCLEKIVQEMRRSGEIDKHVTIEALQTCNYFFYRTPDDRPKRDIDRIWFGKNPLISMDQFLSGIRDDLLLDQVDAHKWIRGRTVAGFIDLPIVNQLAHHSRHELNPSAFDNQELIEQIVYFIVDEIAPRLEERYNLREDQGKAAEAQDDLQVLAGMFPARGPFEGTPPTGTTDGEKPISVGPRTRPEIAISPPKAEKHVIGQEQLFKVVRGPRNGKWRWAKNNPGGSLDVEAGPQVWCTYGNTPGKYTLEYIVPDGKKTSIPIELVEEAPFKLSQGVIYLYPGQEGEVQVLNYDDNDVQFEFDETKRPVKFIKCENLGRGARFIVGYDCPAGYYNFVARGGKGESTKGLVRVHQYPGDFVPMGNRLYELKRNNISGAPVVDITHWRGKVPDGQEDNYRVMLINFTAPPLSVIEAQSGKGPEYFCTARMLAALAHAQDVGEKDALATVSSIVTDSLRQSRKKRKRK